MLKKTTYPGRLQLNHFRNRNYHLARKNQHFQAHVFNICVESGYKEWYGRRWGRDDRPGESSGGSDDEYSKTVISWVGFDPAYEEYDEDRRH